MKTLLTGFQPFGGSLQNPSGLLAKHFGGIVLPVVRQKSFDILMESFEIIKPDAILMLGQAQGIEQINLERIAINLDDYSIPDNDGNQPKEEKIIKDAPDAYFSTLPLGLIHAKLTNHQIPNRYSLSAGTYICNHLFFQVMHFINSNQKNIPAGFIHIPVNMEWECMRKAVQLTLSLF